MRILIFGQSLFEVIFAVGVASLVLLGVVSLAATSVRNSSFSNNNAQATKYAQEGIEWIHQQRDLGWTNLTANLGSKNLGSLSWAAAGCNITTNTFFCRQATLTGVSGDTVDVVVTVSWTDAQGGHQARSATRLTNWNK